MFITINSGSIIYYLFAYLSCLNVNRVCKVNLFSFFSSRSFCHLSGSLARTSCQTDLNEPKLQSLENKAFEFEFAFELFPSVIKIPRYLRPFFFGEIIYRRLIKNRNSRR